MEVGNLKVKTVLIVSILISCLLAINWSCQHTAELTKETAGDMIVEAKGYPRGVFLYLRSGRISLSASSSRRVIDRHQLKDYWERLEERGWVIITDLGEAKSVGRHEIKIDLTAEGRKIFSRAEDIYKGGKVYGDEHWHKAKLCDQVFLEITDMSFSEDYRMAEVRYTWKYANPTEISQTLPSKRTRFQYYWGRLGRIPYLGDIDRIHEATVTFVLSEDGWMSK